MLTIQTILPLNLAMHQPMMTITGARGWLGGKDEDDILDLISHKRIRWAFDIRTKDAKRAEVRIFAPCVAECQQYLHGQDVPPVATEFSVVMRWILPNRDVVRATEIKRALNTSSQHIHNLLTDGSLSAIPGTGNSVNKTPSVTRVSVERFLKERQL